MRVRRFRYFGKKWNSSKLGKRSFFLAKGVKNCMRRTDRERGKDFAKNVIDRCEYGVAAFHTGEDTPYCIPLSLVRVGDDLFFTARFRAVSWSCCARIPAYASPL